MGLANSPGFFQHRMEGSFVGILWKFVLVYMDDVIIWSSSVKQHLQHLDEVLTLLGDSGVTISIDKYHFGLLSI